MLLKCSSLDKQVSSKGKGKLARSSRTVHTTNGHSPVGHSRVHRKVLRLPSKRHPGKVLPGKFHNLIKVSSIGKAVPNRSTTPPCDNSNDSGLGFDQHVESLFHAVNISNGINTNNILSPHRLDELEINRVGSASNKRPKLDKMRVDNDDSCSNDAFLFVRDKCVDSSASLPTSAILKSATIPQNITQRALIKRSSNDGSSSNSNSSSSGISSNSTNSDSGGDCVLNYGTIETEDDTVAIIASTSEGNAATAAAAAATATASTSSVVSGLVQAVAATLPTLQTQIGNITRNGVSQLQILTQPEQQHRARYQTEGSRGAVKDRSGNGFPVVRLVGYNRTAFLEVFIGTDIGRVSPHMFYQACKVSGKNSTPCNEKKFDGTNVIEIEFKPENDMIVTCDCVGILKERNVDVEHRFPDQLTPRNKKKSTRCRMVFRTQITNNDGTVETLQVCSQPIICTQPPGVPEICRKSLVSCPATGGLELFIIGKNFSKDTKIVFQANIMGGGNGISNAFTSSPHKRKFSNRNGGGGTPTSAASSSSCWEEFVAPDREFLQQTHLVCTVPAFVKKDIRDPVTVHLYAMSSGKKSDVHNFMYTPAGVHTILSAASTSAPLIDQQTVDGTVLSITNAQLSSDCAADESELAATVAANTDVMTSIAGVMPQQSVAGTPPVMAVSVPPTSSAFMWLDMKNEADTEIMPPPSLLPLTMRRPSTTATLIGELNSSQTTLKPDMIEQQTSATVNINNGDSLKEANLKMIEDSIELPMIVRQAASVSSSSSSSSSSSTLPSGSSVSCSSSLSSSPPPSLSSSSLIASVSTSSPSTSSQSVPNDCVKVVDLCVKNHHHHFNHVTDDTLFASAPQTDALIYGGTVNGGNMSVVDHFNGKIDTAIRNSPLSQDVILNSGPAAALSEANTTAMLMQQNEPNRISSDIILNHTVSPTQICDQDALSLGNTMLMENSGGALIGNIIEPMSGKAAHVASEVRVQTMLLDAAAEILGGHEQTPALMSLDGITVNVPQFGVTANQTAVNQMMQAIENVSEMPQLVGTWTVNNSIEKDEQMINGNLRMQTALLPSVSALVHAQIVNGGGGGGGGGQTKNGTDLINVGHLPNQQQQTTTAIPQEITNMSDHDLISYINPSCFDQV